MADRKKLSLSPSSVPSLSLHHLSSYLTFSSSCYLKRIVFKLSLFLLLLTRSINGQCTWEYMQTNELKCHIRTLDKSLDLQAIIETSPKRLDIQCNDDLLNQSELIQSPKIFLRLKTLSELQINSCKLQKVPQNAFDGLYSLKKLKISTKNNQYGPNKFLDLYQMSFTNLNELQYIDLSENNIRQLPDGIWCPLVNLKQLNLTMNRLKSIEEIGLNDRICNGQSGSELQELDLSYNELRLIPDNRAISRLRRLQQLKLQYNNITQIQPDAFTGLTSLRMLNLSQNHLETLPAGAFANNRELREIHLQNNELYDIPKGLFHRLEQLLVLDLSGNQLTSHHIDNTTFSGLIRLIVLNLSHNALTRIGGKTFKELYFLQILNLRNNSIGHIEDGAFLPLYNLHTLNLAENRLHTIDNRLFNGLFILSKLTLNNNLINNIESQAFRNCSSLKELDLSSNQIADVPEAIKDLTMLKTLDLGENQIAEIYNGSFRNLNQLTGLRLIDNQIGNITKGMFWDLPNLNVLNLAKNRIQSIELNAFERNKDLEAIRLDRNYLTEVNGIFAALASLLWLNLSENHLVWFDYAFIPKNLKWLDIHANYIESLGNYYKLQEEISLKTLDASHNRITEIGPMSVPNTIELLFINNNLITTIHPNTFVDKTSLVRVDLYANTLTKLQLHTLRVAPVPNEKPVPEFYLGGNPFQCDCSMEWLQRINNLTTRQHPKILDLANIECLMPSSRNEPIRPLVSLSSKDFVCKYEAHCPALCHCCDFDACDCQMICPTNCSCFHDATWSTNIVDCGKQNSNFVLPGKLPMEVTDLYLDGNNLPIISNLSFSGRRSLKSLYLNSSSIVTIENQTFNDLSLLQILHLENNALQVIKGNEFSSLSHLKELYLHNNALSYIGNQAFESLKSLTTLRIDNNRLTTIPMTQLQALQNTNNLQFMSLGRNSWNCKCKFLQDLTQFIADNSLIIQDAQDIYCVDGNIKRELDLSTAANSVECTEYEGLNNVAPNQDISGGYIPLLIAVLVLIFLIVILIVVFVFRESVRVWLFAHYGVRVCESRLEDAGKLYDGIILHSSKDHEFVCRNIASELEHGRPPFRLCIQQRDLPPEASHLQIVEASRASRKIILVLTRNFLQSEWVRPEFRSAFHEALRGLPTKLVIIEETDVCEIAEEVSELSPYLKSMPSNRILTNDPYFWEKLRYAIPIELSSRGNNYTIDHHERFKQPISPGVIFRQAPPPPAYYAEDIEGGNYSSATTATPSPRLSARHARNHMHSRQNDGQTIPLRPPSEHIYSSIESEYSVYDQQENLSMIPNGCSSSSSGNTSSTSTSGIPLSPQQQQHLLLVGHNQQQAQQQQQTPRIHSHPNQRLPQQISQASIWRAMNSNNSHGHKITNNSGNVQSQQPSQSQKQQQQQQHQLENIKNSIATTSAPSPTFSTTMEGGNISTLITETTVQNNNNNGNVNNSRNNNINNNNNSSNNSNNSNNFGVKPFLV
ncbi:toll-like receptor 7 [Condylostylus longicornis]|uniref:toll-like receptor 7 n=1 Tax=Condylostylus longicornis TaxID=2530218 RepID=UPI00244DA418|nr:toll-like receptor 7 [Condylostylus longicornis]